MHTRGRLSAEGQVAARNVLIMPTSRPEPPKGLTSQQAKHWREIVARMPANWFLTEALPILEAYCVQITRQRHLAAKINKLEQAGADEDKEYAGLARRETAGVRALAILATKLRLTPQSTTNKAKQKPVVPMRNPWEEEGE
jgi:phage terminase small subunit